MRKIIALAILVMAITPFVNAGTFDGGYSSVSGAAVFVKYVEQAVTSGRVAFDTPFHRAQFLETCHVLYAASREVEWQRSRDWQICDETAGTLAGLCGWIPDGNQRAWAVKNLEAAQLLYSHSDIKMISTSEQIERHKTRLLPASPQSKTRFSANYPATYDFLR